MFGITWNTSISERLRVQILSVAVHSGIMLDQLSSILQRMFQMSLDRNYIPEIGKSSIVVPVPKTLSPKKLKDFWPVALTSLTKNIFEKFVRNFVLLSVINLIHCNSLTKLERELRMLNSSF